MNIIGIDFKKGNGLVPAIIQEYVSGDVLMLGYMNQKSLEKTKETGKVYFWSRTKKTIWQKGETSGNKLKVKEIYSDCDNDTLLLKVKIAGKNVCHLGRKSCFMPLAFESAIGIYPSRLI